MIMKLGDDYSNFKGKLDGLNPKKPRGDQLAFDNDDDEKADDGLQQLSLVEMAFD